MYVPGMYLVFTWYTPGTYLILTRHFSGTYRVCTELLPGTYQMYHCYLLGFYHAHTLYVLIYFGCAWYLPVFNSVYLGHTWYLAGMYIPSTYLIHNTGKYRVYIRHVQGCIMYCYQNRPYQPHDILFAVFVKKLIRPLNKRLLLKNSPV